MIPTRLLPALLGGLLAGPLQGQDPGLGFFGLGGDQAGVPAFGFLKLPISARTVGLGGHTLTTDEEASLIHGNPAGLALVEDYYYSLSHAEILGEFRHEDLAFTFPTRKAGSLGLSANLLSATEFSDARDIDENLSHPSAYDMALGLAYGKTLWQGRVALGGRLDLIRSAIDQASANGYGVNMGALFFLVRDLRLGFTLLNLSHGVRYDQSGSPLEPLPMGMGLELGKPLLGSRWSGHLGLLQNNEGLSYYYAGGEVSLLKYFLLRAGYDGSIRDRELGLWSGVSAGLGIKHDRLTVDYGFKSLGVLGAYHAVTLNYSRKAKFKDKDEALLEAAKAQYRKGKYAKALALARKAVVVNPYNFKAQALAKELQLEIDRRDETAFAVFYTGNNDGRLTSEWKDGRAVGGLARRKTKLIELKGSQGKSLILDAGNLTNPASSLGQERYVHEAYAQMPYDAVNLGAAELRLGPGQCDPRLPWLSSQKPLEADPRARLGEKTLRLKGGVEVQVWGALDPSALGRQASAGAWEAATQAVKRRMGDPGPRVRILLFHGSLAAARQLAAGVPDLDVILLSGEAQALGMPMKVGQTLICSPGKGSAHIGHLTLVLDSKGNIHSFRHQLIPLDASIPEDPDLKKFLDPVTVNPNTLVLDDYDEEYRAQVMAFVNVPAPGAAGRLYLRDMGSARDYYLPTPGLSCSRPLLGYGKNKVAFLGSDSSGTREIYTAEPGTGRLDTLTRLKGKAREMSWILRNNAILAVYEKDGQADLYRIDPWSREVRNLSGGRFGQVRGFEVAKAGDRLALVGQAGGQHSLWVAALDLGSPLALLKDSLALSTPKWSPQGNRLAFLAFPEGEKGVGELRIFDFEVKKQIPATLQSRVRDFSWSEDGSRIFYVAGVNLLDINEYRVDVQAMRKVTLGKAGPRSEERPTPKVLGTRPGLLFEASEGRRGRILWMDAVTGEETVVADSAGVNTLR